MLNIRVVYTLLPNDGKEYCLQEEGLPNVTDTSLRLLTEVVRERIVSRDGEANINFIPFNDIECRANPASSSLVAIHLLPLGIKDQHIFWEYFITLCERTRDF